MVSVSLRGIKYWRLFWCTPSWDKEVNTFLYICLTDYKSTPTLQEKRRAQTNWEDYPKVAVQYLLTVCQWNRAAMLTLSSNFLAQLGVWNCGTQHTHTNSMTQIWTSSQVSPPIPPMKCIDFHKIRKYQLTLTLRCFFILSSMAIILFQTQQSTYTS